MSTHKDYLLIEEWITRCGHDMAKLVSFKAIQKNQFKRRLRHLNDTLESTMTRTTTAEISLFGDVIARIESALCKLEADFEAKPFKGPPLTTRSYSPKRIKVDEPIEPPPTPVGAADLKDALAAARKIFGTTPKVKAAAGKPVIPLGFTNAELSGDKEVDWRSQGRST